MLALGDGLRQSSLIDKANACYSAIFHAQPEQPVAPPTLSGKFSFASQNYPGKSWRVVDNHNVTIDAPGSAFNIRPGLTNEPGTVSFEDAARPGFFLRHASFSMRCQSGGGPFALDATFRPRPALTGAEGHVSYQSVNFPAKFISHRSFRLKIEDAEDSKLHRHDASFRLLPAAPPPLLIPPTPPGVCSDHIIPQTFFHYEWVDALMTSQHCVQRDGLSFVLCLPAGYPEDGPGQPHVFLHTGAGNACEARGRPLDGYEFYMVVDKADPDLSVTSVTVRRVAEGNRWGALPKGGDGDGGTDALLRAGHGRAHLSWRTGVEFHYNHEEGAFWVGGVLVATDRSPLRVQHIGVCAYDNRGRPGEATFRVAPTGYVNAEADAEVAAAGEGEVAAAEAEVAAAAESELAADDAEVAAEGEVAVMVAFEVD